MPVKKNRTLENLCIALTDIKAAFDSTPNTSLVASLRCLGIPNIIVRLIDYSQTQRKVVIRTAYGLTDPYTPPAGVEQGGTHSPWLWLAFYDALLLALDTYTTGITLDADSWRPGTPGTVPSIRLTNVTVADDLTLIATTREDLEEQFKLTMEFLNIHHTQLSGAKTSIGINKPRLTIADTRPLVLNADTHSPSLNSLISTMYSALLVHR